MTRQDFNGEYLPDIDIVERVKELFGKKEPGVLTWAMVSELIAEIERLRTTVLGEIATERARQVGVEGFTAKHDDEHDDGSMARAAAAYAYAGSLHDLHRAGVEHKDATITGSIWPWNWDWTWWKPKTPRQDLIRAAALIVAEIERLDRKKEAKL